MCLTAQRMHGLEFLSSLVTQMVQDDPTKRPTMDEVVSEFAKIRKKQGSWKLRSRLVPRDEDSIRRLIRSVGHFFRTVVYLDTMRPAIPSV